MLTGKCLCGAVEYAVEDHFEYAGYCHCAGCRAASGSAFLAFAGIRVDKLQMAHGNDAVAVYQRNEDCLVYFCGTCRSPLYSVERKGEYIHVFMGTLSDSPTIRPQFYMFADSKAPWYDIADGLPQFSEYPPL